MADDQQYILRWHHHESTLLSGLPELLDADILTDITLSAGCGHIKAHRLVLATCSTYFLELFQDMPPLQHPVIVLKDIDYDDLYCLITFMYRGHCRVSAERLQNLLTTAKMLRIRGLCDMQVPPVNYAPPRPIKPECDFNGNFEPKLSPPILSPPPSMSISTVKPPLPFQRINLNQPSQTECPICGKQLSNQYNLRVHLETHENGQHACNVCPHVSRSRDALRKHVSYRHPELSTSSNNDMPPRKRSKISNPIPIVLPPPPVLPAPLVTTSSSSTTL